MAALVSVQQSDLLFLSSSSTCNSFNRYEPRFSVSSREGCNGKFAAKDKTLINDQWRIVIKHIYFSDDNISGATSAVICVVVCSVNRL